MQINTLQEKAQNWTKSPLGIFLNNLQWSLASACNILVLFLISAKSGSMPSPPHSQGICVWFSSKGFLHLFFIHHSIRPRGLIVHHRHLIPATSSPSRHSSSSSLSARRWTSFISSWGNLQFGWRAQISTPCLFVKPLWRAHNVRGRQYTRGGQQDHSIYKASKYPADSWFAIHLLHIVLCRSFIRVTSDASGMGNWTVKTKNI